MDGAVARPGARLHQSTRAEPGNLWFEWNRSVEEPDTFTLVEAFTDDGAGPHVKAPTSRSDEDMRPALVHDPGDREPTGVGSGWDEMGELQVD